MFIYIYVYVPFALHMNPCCDTGAARRKLQRSALAIQTVVSINSSMCIYMYEYIYAYVNIYSYIYECINMCIAYVYIALYTNPCCDVGTARRRL